MIQPDANGLYHPANETQIIELIRFARQNKRQLRVRGAAQSVAQAVFTDGYTGDARSAGSNINMELDQMRSVSFDTGKMQVTVGAGCNLGFDPFDPSSTSTEQNSLYYQLNQKGWAIPNVTDAIHQTVGGFISTGSSAGTMQHPFDACIVAIQLVDGTGTVRKYQRTGNMDDPFYAVGVSLGLLGVITSITLQCVPVFNIIGQEAVTNVEDCTFDLFGPGDSNRPSLQQYLTNTEFSRTLWWPFKTLHRAIAWQARTMTASDYNPQTGTPQQFKPKPYQPVFPKVFGSDLPSETVAATGFSLIAGWPKWFYDLLGHGAASNSPVDDMVVKAIETIAPYLYPVMINFYFPCNTATNPPQQFWDNWLGSLPMDRVEFSNDLFDLRYAELWFPIDQARTVVDLLQRDYDAKGFSATGFYTVEILAAKQSPFWMSPGYQQDSMRLNFMFFNRGATIDPETYFNQFWTLFQANNIDFRPHWGKNLPLITSTTGVSYLQQQFPKWAAFMQLRTQMDPDNIFLTQYWKDHLGLSV